MDTEFEKLVAKSIDAELINGIVTCAKEEIWGAVLILLYAGIDTMAWLAMPETQDQNTPQDFQGWVEKHMKQPDGTSYPGLELWAARCGIMHQFGPYSRDVRLGKAKGVGYTTKQDQPAIRQLVVEGKPILIIQAHLLIKAFSRGARAFLSETRGDPKRKTIVKARLRTLYQQTEA